MNFAIILAGGKGLRTGFSTPKQFLEIDNIPMIARTIKAFNDAPEIDEICVVCVPEFVAKMNKIANEFYLNKVKCITQGGDTRQASVFAGLKAIKDNAKEDDIVLIHDGARPFVDRKIILDNLDAVSKTGAVVTAIRTKDSILVSLDGKEVYGYMDRSQLFNVQTPQTFKFGIIYHAHESAVKDEINDATDDACLVVREGKKVVVVEGNPNNNKITYKEDLDEYLWYNNSVDAKE